jgi:PTH1 family peptidyl-tRNA hydrolase
LPSHLIVGLGNPGAKYIATRHNLGFRAVELLAEAYGTRIRRPEYRALTAMVPIGRSEVLLMKPQTYMNASGQSVADACGANSIPTANVIVLCDDADLDVGRIRIRQGGGSGGHRGLASVLAEIHAADFIRVRLGIGRPPTGVELDDYVLAEPRASDGRILEELAARGAQAAAAVITKGLEASMREFNGLPPS